MFNNYLNYQKMEPKNKRKSKSKDEYDDNLEFFADTKAGTTLIHAVAVFHDQELTEAYKDLFNEKKSSPYATGPKLITKKEIDKMLYAPEPNMQTALIYAADFETLTYLANKFEITSSAEKLAMQHQAYNFFKNYIKRHSLSTESERILISQASKNKEAFALLKDYISNYTISAYHSFIKAAGQNEQILSLLKEYLEKNTFTDVAQMVLIEESKKNDGLRKVLLAYILKNQLEEGATKELIRVTTKRPDPYADILLEYLKKYQLTFFAQEELATNANKNDIMLSMLRENIEHQELNWCSQDVLIKASVKNEAITNFLMEYINTHILNAVRIYKLIFLPDTKLINHYQKVHKLIGKEAIQMVFIHKITEIAKLWRILQDEEEKTYFKQLATKYPQTSNMHLE